MRSGVAEDRAGALAEIAVMTLEGALILARVSRSTQPILLAVREIAAAFERG